MNAAVAERPPKPKVPPFTGLPDIGAMRELQQYPQWVGWDFYWKKDKKKWDKPPVNPNTGEFARTSDPTTWSDYKTAAKQAEMGRLAGVGFALAKDGNLTGIDLDKCRNPETGEFQHWAQAAIDFGETYAEVSPSGTGLRFFVEGLVDGRKIDAAQVEIYTEGRYLTVTGQHVTGTPTDIRPAPRLVAYLQERADQFRAAQQAAAEMAREVERKRSENGGAKAGERPKANGDAKGAGADSFWTRVNSLALQRLDRWVPMVFPTANHQSGTGGYRVPQFDLGQPFEEDLSIHPDGIVDWGVHDMGDARRGARTAIDIVQEHLPAWDAAEAALWLCEQLGVPPEELGWRAKSGIAEPSFEEARDQGPASEQPRNKPREIPLRWHGDGDPNADRDWLVRNLVFETGRGLLGGQWGAGKTFGALDLSASVMTGLPFAGRKVMRRGGVLFIAPEGAFEIPIRLRGIIKGKLADAAFSYATEGFSPVDTERLPIAWVEECPPLTKGESIETLKLTAAAAAEHMRAKFDLPLALVIIDTMAAAAGFDDENSAAEAQKALDAMGALSRATGAFVLGVDHFGKASETGIRGSSAKPAAADVVLAMLANRGENGEISNTRMAVHKVRGARCGYEIPYSLDVVKLGEAADGEPITTCIVSWQSESTSETAAKPARKPLPRSLKVFRDAMLIALASMSKRVRPFGEEGPEVLAIAQNEVRAEFFKAYPADGDTDALRQDARKKGWSRALRAAVENELIATRELSGIPHLWFIADQGEGTSSGTDGTTP